MMYLSLKVVARTFYPGQVTRRHIPGLAYLRSFVYLLIARSFRTIRADWHSLSAHEESHFMPSATPPSLVNLSSTTTTTTTTTNNNNNKILLVYCLLLLLIIIIISLASWQSAESLLSPKTLSTCTGPRKLSNSGEMVSKLAKIFSLPPLRP